MQHEAKRWLIRLLENGDNFGFSLEDMASKIMTTLTCTCMKSFLSIRNLPRTDKRTGDDPSLSEYCTVSAWGLLTQMSPAGPITNVLTPLWHVPGNPWKRAERIRHDNQQAWWMDRLLTTRAKMQKGDQRPCFTKQYLDSEKTTNLSGDYEASSVIGMMALVGIFTVAGPLNYWLLSVSFKPSPQFLDSSP